MGAILFAKLKAELLGEARQIVQRPSTVAALTISCISLYINEGKEVTKHPGDYIVLVDEISIFLLLPIAWGAVRVVE